MLQYRKRYELLQLDFEIMQVIDIMLLQYRKRYELLQLIREFQDKVDWEVTIPQAVGAVATIGNTHLSVDYSTVTIPQAVGAVATSLMAACLLPYSSLQYRKRYELLQLGMLSFPPHYPCT